METTILFDTGVIIALITGIFATIRSFYLAKMNRKSSEQISRLNYKLNILSQNTISLANEERSAIIEYYKSFQYWFRLITDYEAIQSNINVIESTYQKILEASEKVSLTESKAELYIDDDNFPKLARELNSATLELEKHYKNYLLGLKEKLLEGRVEGKQNFENFAEKHKSMLHPVISALGPMRRFLQSRIQKLLEENS